MTIRRIEVRERVMAKLRMKSVADLTRFVVEMGLEDEGSD